MLLGKMMSHSAGPSLGTMFFWQVFLKVFGWNMRVFQISPLLILPIHPFIIIHRIYRLDLRSKMLPADWFGVLRDSYRRWLQTKPSEMDHVASRYNHIYIYQPAQITMEDLKWGRFGVERIFLSTEASLHEKSWWPQRMDVILETFRSQPDWIDEIDIDGIYGFAALL